MIKKVREINKVCENEPKSSRRDPLKKSTAPTNVTKTKPPPTPAMLKAKAPPKARAKAQPKPVKSTPSSKSAFNCRTKILYAADSVGNTASVGTLEYFTDSRVRTIKAYSSVHDSSARWPKQNFTDVVKFALENQGRDKFDVADMSAPTVDIT